METMNKCTFKNLRNKDYVLTGQLVAIYEVNLSAMCCDYYHELNAHELFELWVKEARKLYPDGFVPITWLAALWDKPFKPEYMPYQKNMEGECNFLTYFSHPVYVGTGEPIDWFTLPVVSPRWDSECKQTGGFIEAATGWKPVPLQSTVSIESLVQSAKAKKYQNAL